VKIFVAAGVVGQQQQKRLPKLYTGKNKVLSINIMVFTCLLYSFRLTFLLGA